MTQQHQTDRRAFSAAALAEAEAVSKSVIERLAGRPVVQGMTIDGPTSMDLDDAFWLERLPQGGYQLQVSIADVGSWVTPLQTPTLDAVALKRAFTRYDGEHYRPMLPRLLSEDQLSLLEGGLRPAITITLLLDEQLRHGDSSIAQTALRSSKRWSYTAVERELDDPQTPLAPMLQLAYVVAQGLLRGRRLRGALAAYHLPTGWITTEDGLLRKLEKGERYKAQFITAEFMILANQAFAHFFASRGILALYRNQKATAIAPERATLLQLLDTAVQHPNQVSPERIRATFQLAMERASYAPTVEGHFGLNLPAYLHMTSPIRRYVDLVNQRVLLAVLKGKLSPYEREDLEDIAEAINQQEQRVKDARGNHFLEAHDRRLGKMVAAEANGHTASSLALPRLDAKKFHSIIRMAAEGQTLPPAVEQEILNRLAADRLYEHDLFTLVFRFKTSGAAWDRVKTAALHALARTPEHANSMLLMGQHTLGWSAPVYEFASDQGKQASWFACQVSVRVAGREYASGWQRASKKSRAKQLASAEVLARIAGYESAALLDGAAKIEPADRPGEASGPLANYKGQLVETVQACHWENPVYTLQGRSGPSHAPRFTVEGAVVAAGTRYTASGEGPTKAQAEQQAAQKLLHLLPQHTLAARPAGASSGKQVPRNTLHEMQQRGLLKSLTYAYEHSGSEHEGLYTCTCVALTADERSLAATGTGTTKRQAAQEAALQMVALLAVASPAE